MSRGRPGPGSRVAQDIVRSVSNEAVRKLATVRALWLAVQNEPGMSVKDLSAEFYYAVGRVLEGKSLHELELHHIDPKRVAPFLKEK